MKITDSSSMTAGDTYAVDYRDEVAGSHTLSGASSPPRERVASIPGVTSSRQASQIAFTLADDVADPRYAADLTIPQADVTFDVVEALTLANLDLPPVASPLEVRDQPSVSPDGISLRVGSRGTLEAELADIAEQVRQVSQRS